ncbi:MAG: BirA family biotin operon repressor/biotin-[acetyl-CoA-carboxylase] ligase [Candidatus Omnitrophota bacterium]
MPACRQAGEERAASDAAILTSTHSKSQIDPRIIDRLIVRALLGNKEPLSGAKLSAELGLSRTAIWKRVLGLKEAGFDICSHKGQGYELRQTPKHLTSEEIEFYLLSDFYRNKVHVYKELDSTNRLMLEWAQSNYPEGSVIFAEKQLAGKGRRGRVWESPADQGLYFSILLRPNLSPNQLSLLTLTASIAVVEALRQETHLNAQIKWPNDIWINEKKCAGILTEMISDSDSMNSIIIGIGLNVNTSEKDLPKSATSLNIEAKRNWNRSKIAASVLNQFELLYNELSKKGWSSLKKKWLKYAFMMHTQVSVKSTKTTLHGIAKDIDAEGALIIQDKNNQLHRVLSGDVSLTVPQSSRSIS